MSRAVLWRLLAAVVVVVLAVMLYWRASIAFNYFLGVAMSVLCDSQIKSLCLNNALANPFDETLVNPASIDLRVGDMFCSENLDSFQNPSAKLWNDARPLGDGYLLKWGQTILLDTIEYVRIPNHLMAEMWLKSSAGRNGLDIYKACYIDPGFEGTLTFRLTNESKRPDLVKPGQRLVQMVLREMSKVPDRPYGVTGRYNGQRGPTAAR